MLGQGAQHTDVGEALEPSAAQHQCDSLTRRPLWRAARLAPATGLHSQLRDSIDTL